MKTRATNKLRPLKARITAKPKKVQRVDWSTSAALTMDKSGMRRLTVKESADLLAASRGYY